MNAILKFPAISAAAASNGAERSTGTHGPVPIRQSDALVPVADYRPLRTLAFYRKHTHTLLRRYLYASMLVGRAPAILKEPLLRGWASSRPVQTFEDCMIFVFDMEKCLAKLGALDRLLITRIAIQEYSYAETALLFNKSERAVVLRFGHATDRLTEVLLEMGILTVPRPDSLADDDGLHH
jgi:Sigma-70, region 4